MDIKTTDLYLTAYLLSNNISPQTIITEDRNRKKIIFVFLGSQQVLRLMEEFRSGQATANIVLFRSKLEYARDVMFARLRDT